jgi:hypothetical protein
MEKMRHAGFSILFIGIESVNQNSLLETAKVQNTHNLGEAVETVQSYGFIIAPGFIFGFDSDTETIFDDTLEFLSDTGIIGGDPSFLTALPGTPLMQRLKDSGRLIDDNNNATIRAKVRTNIRYLQNTDFLIDGFRRFIKSYTKADYQLQRYRNHVEKIIASGNFVPIDGVGYGSPVEYLKLQLSDPNNRKMLLLRILYLLYKPNNLIAVLKARRLTKSAAAKGFSLDINFNYWVYVWTNIGLKYWGLKRSDFDIESVGQDFDFSLLLGDATANSESSVESRKRGDVKSTQQARYTNQALEKIIQDHSPENISSAENQ